VNASLFPSDDELEGLLVGPDSVTWRFASDARLYLGMLYPLLLQVAHPTVAAGVHDFSDFEERPWERLLRTLDYVTLLAYGGRDAVAAGRRLRELHKQFRGVGPDGERYSALEPSAYAWVHATVLNSYVAGHQHFGRPMSGSQKDRFYKEYRGLGRLIGVRERDLPPDWAGFRSYFEEMIDSELVRTESVDRVLRSVTRATPPPLPLPDLLWRTARFPAQRALWLGGIGLMPGRLRERLAIRWSTADQAAFRTLGALTRRTTPLMPQRLRVMGPQQLRMRRRAISHGPLGESTPPPGRRGATAAA
jgi:uncharacterized protein (DUF2236 family)